MAKLTKEELSKRINDLELDDDLKISLMEDIADSIADESEELAKLKEDIAKLTEDYNGLKEKYKSRFFESDNKEEVPSVEEEVTEEEKEEEVIDIKEI